MESLNKYNSVCPIFLWPNNMIQMIIKSKHLNRSSRIKSVCFLFGNGISSKSDIIFILNNKLRDRSAVMHIYSIINDIINGTYDSSWTYYNVNEKCMLYLNGKICYKEQKKISTTNLKINEWSRYSSHFKTTYKMQLDFFGEDTKTCEKVYNSLQKK